jgi:DNA-binding GntR family transcriptional regulator
MIENRILTDHVYERIREMILNGELPPRTKINKNQLASYLEVSLTPINTAISRLTGEQLIEQRNRFGFFVKDFTCKELKDLYAVRAGLEGIALRLCIEAGCAEHLAELAGFFRSFELPMSEAQRRAYEDEDKRFHSRIIEYSDNRMIREMNESFAYIMRSYQKGLVRPPEETLSEHRRIVDAIERRDGFEAQEMMIQHHLSSRQSIVEHCVDAQEEEE